jgi:hypothetical protein
MKNTRTLSWAFCIALIPLSLPATTHAQNNVMGAVQFQTSQKAERSAGVWIDGRYVGFISELRGYDKVMLLPGPHNIQIRQAGYTDFAQNVDVQPGTKIKVRVAMQKDPQVQYAKNPAVLKLEVTPMEAGVFLDGAFAGYGQEFQGVGRAMLVNPGTHRIKFVLPGYQDFEAQVELLPKQKSTIKAVLVSGPSTLAALSN